MTSHIPQGCPRGCCHLNRKPHQGKVLLAPVLKDKPTDLLKPSVLAADQPALWWCASIMVLLLHTSPLPWGLVPSSPVLWASIPESNRYAHLCSLSSSYDSGSFIQIPTHNFCPWLRGDADVHGDRKPLWGGTFGSPPVSMQGYDGGGSLQFPLESFMWDRSEAKFFKYESARITRNFLQIKQHSFTLARFPSEILTQFLYRLIFNDIHESTQAFLYYQ